MKTVLFILLPIFLHSQTMFISGEVMDDDSYPLEGVSIHYDDQYFLTDSLGQYQIEITQKNQVHLTFHHLSYKKYLGWREPCSVIAWG